jgi:hypothetical protein
LKRSEPLNELEETNANEMVYEADEGTVTEFRKTPGLELNLERHQKERMKPTQLVNSME